MFNHCLIIHKIRGYFTKNIASAAETKSSIALCSFVVNSISAPALTPIASQTALDARMTLSSLSEVVGGKTIGISVSSLIASVKAADADQYAAAKVELTESLTAF